MRVPLGWDFETVTIKSPGGSLTSTPDNGLSTIDIKNLLLDFCGGLSYIEIHYMTVFETINLCSDVIYLYNITIPKNDVDIIIEGKSEVVIEFATFWKI